MKHNFICIEGGEGVGKSTFITSLKNHFVKNGHEVVLTRQPGGTKLAEDLRELFLKSEALDPLTELFLLLAGRREHLLQVVQPALEAGKVVLCDRYHLSTYVYQGYLGGLPAETIRNCIHSLYVSKVQKLEPSVYFLLDCPVEEARKRLTQREEVHENSLNRYDRKSEQFHQEIREGYLKGIKEVSNGFVLNAEQTIDELVHQAVKHLGELRS